MAIVVRIGLSLACLAAALFVFGGLVSASKPGNPAATFAAFRLAVLGFAGPAVWLIWSRKYLIAGKIAGLVAAVFTAILLYFGPAIVIPFVAQATGDLRLVNLVAGCLGGLAFIMPVGVAHYVQKLPVLNRPGILTSIWLSI